MRKIPKKIPPEVIYDGKDLEALAALRRYREWIMKYFYPYLSGDVVEIGAGVGSMAAHLYPHVSSLDLVEPSPNLIAPLRSRFSNSATVSVMHETLESFVAKKSEKNMTVSSWSTFWSILKKTKWRLKNVIRLYALEDIF